ncbi:MAG TPA: peroxidase family protein [Steroidobacteraceae bacterium]|jgi:hypothetical protein
MPLDNNKIADERDVSTRTETFMAATTDPLDDIANAMTGSLVEAQGLHAGYTYLGQFISHDIVRVTNPQPGQPLHLATPVLDLDSVYGATPGEVPHIVDDRFVLGSNGDDLQRIDGVAQIPDPRNDDNVIVSQLHLFMQRFHNFTIDQGYAADAAAARKLVTLVFQLVVVEDFLRQILAPPVFESYFRFDRRWLQFDPSRVPPDFSHAAFRFGHSMVRPRYKGFPRASTVAITELFQGGHNLPADLVIDWRHFFGWPGMREPPSPTSVPAQLAARIDHIISDDMRKIATPHGVVDVVRKNLDAGAKLRKGIRYTNDVLDSTNGRAIQSALALVPLQNLAAAPELARAEISLAELPLWPYLLVEAVHASDGVHLGVLGSMICAEVLANSIAKAPTTIYRGRWPSVDEVLTELGGLGEALQEVRRSAAAGSRTTFSDRTFCMRHLIELVPGKNPTTQGANP